MPALDLTISQRSGVPFYRQIVDQIAASIRSGALPPGSRLPSVRELTGQALVSLITVRKAYAELEYAGLIVRRRGQGTFVADDIGQAAHEAAQREGLEVLATAVTRARRLGLDDDTIRAGFEAALQEDGDG